MLRRLILLAWLIGLFFFCASSCSFKRDLFYRLYDAPSDIDIDLYNYMYEFQLLAKQYDVKINDVETIRKLQYGNPSDYWGVDDDTIGLCWQVTIGIPRIVEFESWREIVVVKPKHRDTSFELLVYHELFHCLLNMGHVDDPEDLMFPYETPEQLINPDEKIERVFLRAKEQQLKEAK